MSETQAASLPNVRTRWQFSVNRALLIVATFGVALATGRFLSSEAHFGFLLSAVAISGIIVLASRDNLRAIIGTVLWTLTGAFLGSTCLWNMILSAIQPVRQTSDPSGPLFFAICGAVLGWLIGDVVRSQLRAAADDDVGTRLSRERVSSIDSDRNHSEPGASVLIATQREATS